MPFTVNPGAYQGGQFFLQAGQNLSENIIKAMDEWKKAKQDEAANQMIVNYAMNTKDEQGNPLMSPEEHTKFLQGNANAKSGMIAGLVRRFALDTQRQQTLALQEQRQATAELRKQQAQDYEARAKQRGMAGQPIWIQDESGNWKVVGVHGAEGPHLFTGGMSAAELGEPKVTQPKDEQGQPLPFRVVTYGKTMSVQPNVPPGYFPDPSGETDQLGTYDKNGKWTAAPWQAQMMIQMNKQKAAAATTNRGPGFFAPGGTLNKALGYGFGAIGAPAPFYGAGPTTAMPTPTPAGGAGGQGGYIPGRRYSGMTYLGGDPNDANNWQK